MDPYRTPAPAPLRLVQPQFNTGDIVMTPGGKGVVVSRRMAPPDYCKVAAYSVRLDSINLVVRYDYVGTTYAAEHVVKL